jgi:hypothetical protein
VLRLFDGLMGPLLKDLSHLHKPFKGLFVKFDRARVDHYAEFFFSVVLLCFEVEVTIIKPIPKVNT